MQATMDAFALTSCIIHGWLNANETADVYERTRNRGHQCSAAPLCPLLAGAQTHADGDLQVLIVCRRDNASDYFHRWHLT